MLRLFNLMPMLQSMPISATFSQQFTLLAVLGFLTFCYFSKVILRLCSVWRPDSLLVKKSWPGPFKLNTYRKGNYRIAHSRIFYLKSWPIGIKGLKYWHSNLAFLHVGPNIPVTNLQVLFNLAIKFWSRNERKK